MNSDCYIQVSVQLSLYKKTLIRNKHIFLKPKFIYLSFSLEQFTFVTEKEGKREGIRVVLVLLAPSSL